MPDAVVFWFLGAVLALFVAWAVVIVIYGAHVRANWPRYYRKDIMDARADIARTWGDDGIRRTAGSHTYSRYNWLTMPEPYKRTWINGLVKFDPQFRTL